MPNNASAVIAAINDSENPATYSSLHLVQSGSDRWISLSGGVFSLTASSPPTGLKITEGMFTKCVGAIVDGDGYVIASDETVYQAISQSGFFKLVDP